MRVRFFSLLALLTMLVGTVACASDPAKAKLDHMEEAIKQGENDYNNYLVNGYFDDIRSTPRFAKLVELAKQSALQESQQKAISLKEGEWHTFELDRTYHGGPAEAERRRDEVQVSLQYDEQGFTIKAVVNDAQINDGERSWRYGDGFFVVFATPESDDEVYTDQAFGYGFSLEHGRPVAILVNKDSTHPYESGADIAPDIEVNEAAGAATYLFQIPWSRLYPFHPLLDMKAGINIIYVSQNDDGSRNFTTYVRDVMYDTESTKLRRFVPLHFAPSETSRLQIAGTLESRLVHEAHVSVSLAVWAPDDLPSSFSITVEDSRGNAVSDMQFEEELTEGKNVVNKEIALPISEGICRVTVTLNDSLTWEDDLYKYDQSRLTQMKEDVESLTPAPSDLFLRTSKDALTYRLQVLEERISRFSGRERDEPREVRGDVEEFAVVFETCIENGSLYAQGGYVLSAFQSSADSSLQPFSIYLPKRFDPDATYDLVVALRGSGSDEVGIVEDAAMNIFAGREFIVVGPRGRDPSHWYTGFSESDVVDAVQLAKKMFKVGKTLCYGYSIGGYGTWRMTFLHPELFDGAVVVSGRPDHITQRTEENDMRNHIGKVKDLPFLVIHGTEDHSVPIEVTDDFVTKLKEAGYNVVYERVPGGGHTDVFPVVKRLAGEWLEEQFGHTR